MEKTEETKYTDYIPDSDEEHGEPDKGPKPNATKKTYHIKTTVIGSFPYSTDVPNWFNKGNKDGLLDSNDVTS